MASGSDDGTRIGADANIKMELESALKEILDMSHKLDDFDERSKSKNLTKPKI